MILFNLENKLGKVDLNELSQAIHDEDLQRTSTSPFVVVDLVNYVNPGRRVKPARKQVVFDQFKDLHEKMSKQPNLTVDELFQPLNRLKVSVSDFNHDGSRRVTRF